MEGRARPITAREAWMLWKTYRAQGALQAVAMLHRRSVSAVARALNRFGYREERRRGGPRSAAQVRAWHWDYLRLSQSLAATGRMHGVSAAWLRTLFVRHGLAVRPYEERRRRLPSGGFAPHRRLSNREVVALVSRARRFAVPRDLLVEWRGWSLGRRKWLIDLLRDKLRPRGARPTTPFSPNVEPFDYGSPKAWALVEEANRGLSSRHWKARLSPNSQGVIWRGKLWFWSGDGYLLGGWGGQPGRPALHHELWKEATGAAAVPARHVVVFLDGNKNNLDPSNLGLRHRRDLASENQARHLLARSRRLTSLVLRQKGRHAKLAYRLIAAPARH